MFDLSKQTGRAVFVKPDGHGFRWEPLSGIASKLRMRSVTRGCRSLSGYSNTIQDAIGITMRMDLRFMAKLYTQNPTSEQVMKH